MKRILFFTASLLMLIASTPKTNAQEWTAGLDIFSSYVWRGTKFGSGPAFQPTVEFSVGSLAIGAWGSYSASIDEAAEADLYASYGIDLGENASLAITLTDYYFPYYGMGIDDEGLNIDYSSYWFDGDSHYIEPMVTLGIGPVSLTGAYMMNGGEGDIYFEAGVSAGSFDVTLGGGDGAYTTDGKFNVCNIAISTSKELPITEKFSLPLSGAIILNPSSEQFNVVVGISL